MNSGKILQQQGRRIVVDLDEELNRNYIDLIRGDDSPSVVVELIDSRNVSPEQRKLIYALIRDISAYTGYEPQEAKAVMKFYFEEMTGKNISFSDCSKSEAGEFIKMLITFVIKNHVPLAKRYEYLTQDNYYFYCCVKYRECCICGKPHADIHHLNAVGMGRNRRHIDHTKHGLCAVCRICHEKAHKMGVESFLREFKVLPVYLSDEDIKRLKLADKQFIEDFERHRGEQSE